MTFVERSVEKSFTSPTVSEARLASVLAMAVDAIVIIDDKGRVLMFNRACEELFGYSAQDMLGQNIKEIMPPDYMGAHDRFVSDYVRTGRRKIIGIGREVTGRHRDGTVFPIELSVGEAATPDGRQFIGVMRDLRPRRETEQRLNQMQADLLRMARVSAMDEMGAALAHELNQPLTALMLYLQAANRANAKQMAEHRMPEQVLSILNKAVHEAERAGAIIQRIRHFVEKRDPVRRVIDLGPLVDDAIELTLLGQPPGTRVTRNFATDLPQVNVDPIQIQQVIVNLVRNAIEAVRQVESAEVQVSTRAMGNLVVVSVEDNGPGIPPAVVPTLFKAFNSSKGSGLGIGLAISKTIIQNHGGDLMVDPGGNGRGACFTLTLPVADESAPDWQRNS